MSGCTLDVPFFWQQKDYWCAAASLKMLLAAYGRGGKQSSLARLARTDVDGVSAFRLQKTLEFLGIACQSKEGGTLTRVRSLLRQRRPVVVGYIEPADGDHHFAIIVGLMKKDVILNDPWHGRGFRMSRREFCRRWRADYNCWMLVPDDPLP